MGLLAAAEALAAEPPALPRDLVAGHVAREYGLEGALDVLVSERDQNFRLRVDGDGDYVVKIASLAEDPSVTDFQVAALEHLELRTCAIDVPRVIRSLDGAMLTSIGEERTDYKLRVVSWLPGQPLEGGATTNSLARNLGRGLASIDAALADFRHPGECQTLLWDMQRAAELRSLLRHVDDAQLRGDLESCLDDFEARALPRFTGLRQQVIHNDLNPGNVLVADDDPMRVTGVIDFGDMLRAPLIVDVAVALAYLRSAEPDALQRLAEFVAGFNERLSLEVREVELLYDLVRVRLATTITILHWRAALRSDDNAYLRKSLAEHSAEKFLRRINSVPREEFSARMCDMSTL